MQFEIFRPTSFWCIFLYSIILEIRNQKKKAIEYKNNIRIYWYIYLQQKKISTFLTFNLDAIPRCISNFWPMNGQRTKCLSLLHISKRHSSIGRKFKELTECNPCTHQRVAVNPIIYVQMNLQGILHIHNGHCLHSQFNFLHHEQIKN